MRTINLELNEEQASIVIDLVDGDFVERKVIAEYADRYQMYPVVSQLQAFVGSDPRAEFPVDNAGNSVDEESEKTEQADEQPTLKVMDEAEAEAEAAEQEDEESVKNTTILTASETNASREPFPTRITGLNREGEFAIRLDGFQQEEAQNGAPFHAVVDWPNMGAGLCIEVKATGKDAETREQLCGEWLHEKDVHFDRRETGIGMLVVKGETYPGHISIEDDGHPETAEKSETAETSETAEKSETAEMEAPVAGKLWEGHPSGITIKWTTETAQAYADGKAQDKPNAKFTAENVVSAYCWAASGKTPAQIAKQMEISKRTISSWLSGESRSNMLPILNYVKEAYAN